jgi:hypothetical protein
VSTLIQEAQAWRQEAPARVLFGSAVVVSMVCLVLLRWTTGEDAHAGLFGYVPLSDANGYYHCAVAIRGGSFVGDPELRGALEWCSRRAIWPVSLGAILSVVGGNAGAALLLQSMLMGLALAVSAIRVREVFGWGPAAVMSVLILHFAYLFVTGTFLTENWGLIAGLLALAFLLRCEERSSGVNLAVGFAFLSLAMSARAGALFVIPLLVVWTLASQDRRSLRDTWLPLVALAIGPVLHVLGAVHLTGGATNSGGNYAASLYALSVGSRDWQATYRDFAELFATRPESEVFREVYGRAIQNILASPATFFSTLLAAHLYFWQSLFEWQGFLASVALKLLLFLGLVFAALRRHGRVVQLVVLVFLGEVLSAAWIIDSGGERVFAATFWARGILVGLGLVLLVDRLRKTQTSPCVPCATGGAGAAVGTAALGCVVGALSIAGLFLPSSPPNSANGPQPSSACTTRVITARVGTESPAVTFSGRLRFPWWGPMERDLSLPDRHEFDRSLTNWSGLIGKPSMGMSLIAAFDATPGRPATFWPLVVEAGVPLPRSGLYEICVGAPGGRFLGGYPMHAVESMRLLR